MSIGVRLTARLGGALTVLELGPLTKADISPRLDAHRLHVTGSLLGKGADIEHSPSFGIETVQSRSEFGRQFIMVYPQHARRSDAPNARARRPVAVGQPPAN